MYCAPKTLAGNRPRLNLHGQVPGKLCSSSSPPKVRSVGLKVGSKCCLLIVNSSGLGLAARKRGYYLAGRLYWACRRSHWDLHIIHRGFPGTSQLNIAI